MSDDQDPLWDALEEMYHDGEVDVAPGIGSDTEPEFTLTDDGVKSAIDLLAEDDQAVMYFLQMVITAGDAGVTEERVASVIAKMAPLLRDDAGVNLLRVLNRQDPSWFNTDALTESDLEAYDP